eukprot:2557668-Amphidinium_carterae.1
MQPRASNRTNRSTPNKSIDVRSQLKRARAFQASGSNLLAWLPFIADGTLQLQQVFAQHTLKQIYYRNQVPISFAMLLQ